MTVRRDGPSIVAESLRDACADASRCPGDERDLSSRLLMSSLVAAAVWLLAAIAVSSCRTLAKLL
jgi:hypothetical protein